MSSSKITLIGINNYFNIRKNDMFKYLSLPAGIDKEVVTNNILMKGGEFESLYGDPDFVQRSIATWSKKWFWTFDKWYKAINIEYDPLENYNRIEEWTDDNAENINSQRDIQESGSNTQTNTESGTTTNGTIGTTTNVIDATVTDNRDTETKVSAYDSSSYSPKEKVEMSDTVDTDSTETNTVNMSDTVQFGKKNTIVDSLGKNIDDDTTAHNTEHNVHNGRIHGNIGVTTSQQMLQSELDIATFNLYDQIADIFLREYTIPIY